MYLSYDKGATYEEKSEELFWANITHNLGKMADKAGIYEACWRPYYLHPDCPKEFADYDEECAFEEAHPMLAKDIIQKLEKGYEDMKARPEHYKNSILKMAGVFTFIFYLGLKNISKPVKIILTLKSLFLVKLPIT